MPQTETVQKLRFVLLHVPKFVQRLLDIRAVVPAPPAREEAECIGGRHCRWARQRGDRGHALCQNTLVFESALRSSRAAEPVDLVFSSHGVFTKNLIKGKKRHVFSDLGESGGGSEVDICNATLDRPRERSIAIITLPACAVARQVV